MTEDALSEHRIIAIALLKPGFEAAYDTLEAEIHEHIGIGRILREERLPDGRFNFLLQGLTRARIVVENRDKDYRRAQVKLIAPVPTQPDIECSLKRRLRELFATQALAGIAKEANWPELLACSSFTLSDVVDVIASSLLPRPEDKQCFLSEPSVATRAQCICDVLSRIAEQVDHGCEPRRPRPWPPIIHEN